MILLDETAVIQHGEEFVLFAALDPATREVVHLGVAPSRNYLTTRRFLEEIEELYGDLSEMVITDGARGYGAAFHRAGHRGHDPRTARRKPQRATRRGAL